MRFVQRPAREEGASCVFLSNYIVLFCFFTNHDTLSNAVAANISVPLDIKGLFLAYTKCPFYFIRELFNVFLTQGQRLYRLKCHKLQR